VEGKGKLKRMRRVKWRRNMKKEEEREVLKNRKKFEKKGENEDWRRRIRRKKMKEKEVEENCGVRNGGN
jgi:hypothetical protein